MRIPLESIEEQSQSLIRLSPRVLKDSIGDILLPQQISLFHGPERAPLSIIAHSIAVSAARTNDHICVFLDSGSNYSPHLVRSLCDSTTESKIILERIVIGQVLGIDDVVEKFEMLKQMGKISIVILDSLTGALNLTGPPGTRGRQRSLFAALDSIRRVNNSLDAHFMITDHSSRNWISGEPTPIGGNVVSHAVDSVVLVDRLRSGDDLVRILIERSTTPSPPPGVIIRAGSKGIRSIR